MINLKGNTLQKCFFYHKRILLTSKVMYSKVQKSTYSQNLKEEVFINCYCKLSTQQLPLKQLSFCKIHYENDLFKTRTHVVISELSSYELLPLKFRYHEKATIFSHYQVLYRPELKIQLLLSGLWFGLKKICLPFYIYLLDVLELPFCNNFY